MIIFIGSRQVALANLAHEAWHYLCVKPRWLNKFIGPWVYAYPVGIPYLHDRKRHLTHHSLVGHDHDPDWCNYSTMGRKTPIKLLSYWAGRMFGSLLIETLWFALIKGEQRIKSGSENQDSNAIKVEWLKIGLTQLTILACFTVSMGGWLDYFLYWLLPLSTVCAVCNSFRSFVEHSSAEDHSDVEVRLKDINANWLEAIFFRRAIFTIMPFTMPIRPFHITD